MLSPINSNFNTVTFNSNDNKIVNHVNPDIELNAVFCIPAPGKPNPREPYSLNRSRVKQKKQEGPACVYYALQILRNEQKIGKYPSLLQQDKRKDEKTFSTHRKQMTAIHSKYEIIFDFAKQLTKIFSGKCRRDDAKQYLYESEKRLSPRFREMFCEQLNAYCEQNQVDDFLTFTKENYSKDLIDIHTKTMIHHGISVKDLQETYERRPDKLWKNASIIEKENHAGQAIQILQCIAYDTQNSQWHPEQPIEKLIEQIRLCGPHYVTGYLGKLYYVDSPFPLKNKIEDRPVFGWKPNAQRKEEENISHAVVIVGAKIIKGAGYVYFVDPIDGSMPNQPESQKIYIISYEKLRLFIQDLNYCRTTMQNGKLLYATPQKEGANNYALYIHRS